MIDVVHGDAFELVRGLEAESVDAIVTSPPYADARRDDYPTAPADQFAGWIAPLLEELLRVLRPTGGFMLNLGRVFRDGVEHPYVDDTLGAARELGWLRIDTVVWVKANARAQRAERLHDQHELVFWLARRPDAYRGFDADTRRPYAPETLARYGRWFHASTKGEQRAPSKRQPHPDGAMPGSVFVCSVGREKGIRHPAPMALRLARHLVALACPPGGLVLDPFAGAGTTAVACRDLGRSCIGFELELAHVLEAHERLGQLTLFEASS